MLAQSHDSFAIGFESIKSGIYTYKHIEVDMTFNTISERVLRVYVCESELSQSVKTDNTTMRLADLYKKCIHNNPRAVSN